MDERQQKQRTDLDLHSHTSVSKGSACNAGDLGSIPGSGGSPEEGNSNPLQYSCLENPMDRRAWQATVHGGRKRVRHDLATKERERVSKLSELSLIEYRTAMLQMFKEIM